MNKIILYILIFSAFLAVSCKNKSTSTDDIRKDTVSLKVIVSGSAYVTRLDENDEEVSSSSDLLNGIVIDTGTYVTLRVSPDIEGTAVFWTGGDIDNRDRGKSTVEFQILRDTVLTVVIGNNTTPIDSVALNLIVSDHGSVLVNGDIRTKSAKILLAKSQSVELEAKSDTSYYFLSWDVSYNGASAINSSSEKYQIASMNNEVQVIASFKLSKLGKTLTVRIDKSKGSVNVNGTDYYEDFTASFNRGDKVTLIAKPFNNNDTEGFIAWGGDITNKDSLNKETITFNMDSDIFLEPKFGNKAGSLYVTLNPSTLNDDTIFGFHRISYEVTKSDGTSVKSSSLDKENPFIDELQSGYLITLKISENDIPAGFEKKVSWTGAGAGVGLTTTILYNGSSLSTTASLTPVKYAVLLEVKRVVDDVTPEIDASVLGYTLTVDGVAYSGVNTITRSFEKDRKVGISIDPGFHYTNISLNATTDTSIEYVVTDQTPQTIDVLLGHVSRKVTLNIVGGKRSITPKDYISSVKVFNTGYTSSDISYDAKGDDGINESYDIKVLSGRNVKFVATSSGGHVLTGFNDLDVIEGNVAYFTNAGWDRVVGVRFNSSDVWDGSLVSEPGTDASGVYIINVPPELVWVANETHNRLNDFSGKTVKIARDLDMNNKAFVGISTGSASSVFKGIFDGNGYRIKNLVINGGINVGLIGKLGETGVVEKLTVSSGNISINGGQSLGSIVGSNYKGVVRYITNNATIDGGQGRYTGGIVGYNHRGYISNSFNNGNVKGFYSVGGVLGYNDYGSVSNTANEGKITAVEGGGGNYFGGIVGNNLSGTIAFSYNEGDVRITNSLYVGGIVGEHRGNGSKISMAYNKGLIDVIALNSSTPVEHTGGLIGYEVDTDGTSLQNAYNLGNVKGSYSVGGIAGTISKTGIWENVYSIGTITGRVVSPPVGALIGVARLNHSMLATWYLKNSSYNSRLLAVGETSAIITGGSARDTTQFTMSQLGFSSAGVWEDKTSSVLRISPRAMIKGLGEYNTSK